jgi:hypothetical protein
VRSWDGGALIDQDLAPGDHILVNAGVDAAEFPLVPHFAPKLAALGPPDPQPGRATADAWGPWVDLLRGGGLPGDDPRALIVRRRLGEQVYGSSSASLVAVGPVAARFDFTATPEAPDWREVPLG